MTEEPSVGKTRWASEAEALSFAGIAWDSIEHCPSCHSGDGEEATLEVHLTDGRVAIVCCDAMKALEKTEAIEKWQRT